MKALLTSTVLVALASTLATANIAPYPTEINIYLTYEEIDVKIAGDQAEVTGVFDFTADDGAFVRPLMYLPVYAAEDANPKDFLPTVSIGDKKLKVTSAKEAFF